MGRYSPLYVRHEPRPSRLPPITSGVLPVWYELVLVLETLRTIVRWGQQRSSCNSCFFSLCFALNFSYQGCNHASCSTDVHLGGAMVFMFCFIISDIHIWRVSRTQNWLNMFCWGNRNENLPKRLMLFAVCHHLIISCTDQIQHCGLIAPHGRRTQTLMDTVHRIDYKVPKNMLHEYNWSHDSCNQILMPFWYIISPIEWATVSSQTPPENNRHWMSSRYESTVLKKRVTVSAACHWGETPQKFRIWSCAGMARLSMSWTLVNEVSMIEISPGEESSGKLFT